MLERMIKEGLRDDLPSFNTGDTIKVIFKTVEANKVRHQSFEGIVIRMRGSGLSKTFTLRRVSHGVGVERTFPLHSPNIEAVEIISQRKARRSRLYYLRKRTGKAAQKME